MVMESIDLNLSIPESFSQSCEYRPLNIRYSIDYLLQILEDRRTKDSCDKSEGIIRKYKTHPTQHLIVPMINYHVYIAGCYNMNHYWK